MQNNIFRKYGFGLCALALAAALAVLPFAQYLSACGQVRHNVIRLHVLAASDSETDQAVKLKVRDAILENAAALFGSETDMSTAENIIRNHLDALTEKADAVLEAEGAAYRASAALTEEYFDTRAYGNYTLPAGRYTALKIRLGSGCGQNWWCVVFPPLCLPAAEGESAAAVFRENEMTVLTPAKGYQVRFKLAELAAQLAEKWKNRKK